MFAFRSAIRRLFGISIPNIDRELDADVIAELRAALSEAEQEIILLKFDRNFEALMNAARKAQLLNALGTIMEAYQINGIELVEVDEDDYEDEEDSFPNNVVDSY